MRKLAWNGATTCVQLIRRISPVQHFDYNASKERGEMSPVTVDIVSTIYRLTERSTQCAPFRWPTIRHTVEGNFCDLVFMRECERRLRRALPQNEMLLTSR